MLDDVDVNEIYREWPEIKQFVRRNYGHIAKRQHCVWTTFLNNQGAYYPNCRKNIEIVLVSRRCAVFKGVEHISTNLKVKI